MFRYSVNPESDVPIYRQLADQINAEIRSGALKAGAQLPTVREMAESMRLSCGTIKRVYDKLREMGDIEMTRRRGSFVKAVQDDGDSRKLQAMTAIDRMIRTLTDLRFSPAEIQIFLNIKMREWGLRWSGIRIALVTEYAELAPLFTRQLQRIANASAIICSPRQVREYPYSVDEEADVILASEGDAQMLSAGLPDPSKLVRLAFALRPDSLTQLVRAAGKRLCAVCEDEAFFRLVSGYLPDSDITMASPDGAEKLRAAQIAVAPPDYAAFCTPETTGVLEEMAADGRVMFFEYAIDEGSMLYLEERIARIREQRQLQPGALSF